MRHKQHAFTLVELLVVVAIVALLASLLLPAVVNGKRAARQTVCLNNLRQFGIGLNLYAHDNGDLLPREKAFSHIPSWTIPEHHSWPIAAAATNSDVWYNAVPLAAGQRPLAFYAASNQAEFYASGSGFHCPTARVPGNRGDYPMLSLAINSKLMRGSSYTELISAIEQPSSTVLFTENGLPGERPVCDGQANYTGRPHAYANRFPMRHAKSGNLLMVDGSARSIPVSQVVDLDPTSSTYGGAPYPQLDVIWTADPARDPN